MRAVCAHHSATLEMENPAMNRIEQLAEAYASARLAEAIADPGNIKASASRSAEEIAEAHQVYLEREFKSASRLLELAERRDFSGLSNALHKSNRNWRNLFCEYASVQSIPDTQSGLRDFLRSWIGADEVDRQLADMERIRAEDQAARLAKIAERERAECLKNGYRFCFGESGIVEVTTFGRILDYVAGLSPSWQATKRGAFPIVRLFYGTGRYLEFRKSAEIKEIKSRFPEHGTVNA